MIHHTKFHCKAQRLLEISNHWNFEQCYRLTQINILRFLLKAQSKNDLFFFIENTHFCMQIYLTKNMRSKSAIQPFPKEKTNYGGKANIQHRHQRNYICVSVISNNMKNNIVIIVLMLEGSINVRKYLEAFITQFHCLQLFCRPTFPSFIFLSSPSSFPPHSPITPPFSSCLPPPPPYRYPGITVHGKINKNFTLGQQRCYYLCKLWTFYSKT